MNRFQKKKKYPVNGMVYGLLMAALLVLFVSAVSKIGTDTKDRQLENLQNALDQSVTLCYALEGAYPESLDYLKDHYGVTWNEQKYLVDYETVGSNLPPDITIIQKGDMSGK